MMNLSACVRSSRRPMKPAEQARVTCLARGKCKCKDSGVLAACTATLRCTTACVGKARPGILCRLACVAAEKVCRGHLRLCGRGKHALVHTLRSPDMVILKAGLSLRR